MRSDFDRVRQTPVEAGNDPSTVDSVMGQARGETIRAAPAVVAHDDPALAADLVPDFVQRCGHCLRSRRLGTDEDPVELAVAQGGRADPRLQLARRAAGLPEQSGSLDAVLAQRGGSLRRPRRKAHWSARSEQAATEAESDCAGSEYRDQRALLSDSRFGDWGMIRELWIPGNEPGESARGQTRTWDRYTA